MAQVPVLEEPQIQAESLPGRPYPRVSDEVSSAAFGAPIAEGFEHLSAAAANQQIHNDNLRVIDANTQLEAGRNALLYGKPNPQTGQMEGGAFSLHGIDAINMPDKFGPEYQKLAGQISSTLTPNQQRLFQGHIAAGQNELNLQLNRYEFEESNRLSDQVYKNGLNQAMDSASLGWRDPIVLGKSRADIKALIQMQGDREGWPQSERDVQLREAFDHMHYGIVTRMLADGNASGAQSYLNQHMPEMDPKTSESAQRLLYSTQEHQLMMAEKQQKLASDSLSKEGDSLLAKGQLTPQWIESHRNTLEANEFRYFYKALSGTDEAATNPRVYADLFLKAANGEDVRDDARTALVDSHTLSRADFSKIAGLVDQERPGWFKRGTNFISGSLDPGLLNPDPDAHHSRQLALQDWQEWSSKHPDATDAQAAQQANELADHYRIMPSDKVTLAMKAPMHLVGTRANPVDEQGKPDPMLNATKRRMQAALMAGEITQTEAESEARLILQYRQIYQNQQAAKAAKEKKP